MKRFWLLFSQSVTVLLAAYFVVGTLKPEWLGKRPFSGSSISLIEAPASPTGRPVVGGFSVAAKKASPAVVSINTSKMAARDPRSDDPWFKFFYGERGAQAQVGLGSGVIVSALGCNQPGTVTGWMKQRLALLLRHDINLYAYHLPLDAHPTLGNNAQLGVQLGLEGVGCFGDNDLGFLGQRSDGGAFASAQHLADHIEKKLNRPPVLIAPAQAAIKKIAWCTGGAQGYFEAAIAAGADVFITGEISEPQAHYARECGVAFIACGHHASERYGAPAVAGFVAAQLGLEHLFIDIDNPA